MGAAVVAGSRTGLAQAGSLSSNGVRYLSFHTLHCARAYADGLRDCVNPTTLTQLLADRPLDLR